MIIRGPEGENNQSPRRERENGSENMMAEKFPSYVKDINVQIQEAQ